MIVFCLFVSDMIHRRKTSGSQTERVSHYKYIYFTGDCPYFDICQTKDEQFVHCLKKLISSSKSSDQLISFILQDRNKS